MRKGKILFLLVITVLFCKTIFAKQVTFAVDMSGQTISPNGIHLVGDFQTLAGFSGGDWNPATIAMLQVGSTGIYTVTLNLPAFKKYEYKFVNGNLFYEAEFVPLESRISENNDSRWIYVDSINTNAFHTGEILFAGNAPIHKKLIRFKVDLQEQSSVYDKGVSVYGAFQDLIFGSSTAFAHAAKVYEYIAFVDSGYTIDYKFVNGISSDKLEVIPGPCSVNSFREMTVLKDTVLPVVCFSGCGPCATASAIIDTENKVKLYPVPFQNHLWIEGDFKEIRITDLLGKMVYSNNHIHFDKIMTGDWKNGLYMVFGTQESGESISKLMIKK